MPLLGETEKCGEDLAEDPHHHRHCRETRPPPGEAHDAQQRASLRAFYGGVDTTVRAPRNVARGAGEVKLDDGSLVVRDRRAAQELKTRDLSAPTARKAKMTLLAAEMEERAAMREKYRDTAVAGVVHLVVTSLDGLIAEASLKAMRGLESLHQRAGLEGVFPGPRAAMGVALLQQQTRCHQRWLAGETGAALVAAAGDEGARRVAAVALRAAL